MKTTVTVVTTTDGTRDDVTIEAPAATALDAILCAGASRRVGTTGCHGDLWSCDVGQVRLEPVRARPVARRSNRHSRRSTGDR